VAEFRDFIDSHSDLVASWRGLTPFDVLDLGYRQNGRIRAVIDSGAYDCITPYEDSRWIRHWLTAQVSDRVGQQAYRRLYRDVFADVFWEAQAAGPEPLGLSKFARIKKRLPVGLKRALRRGPPVPPPITAIHGRGDPRRNATMAKVLQETVTAFDNRHVVSGISALTAFRNLMSEYPTDDDFVTVRFAASAEMYMRAGVFGPPL
jgi:hypothetical protein